jgi:hypothetical protein
VLAKKSNADYDTQWVNGGSGSGAVDSVNGKTGTVVLDASDVGALPDDTVIPDAQVNSDWNATSGVAKILNKPDLSGYYSKPSGGIPKTDLASAVQTSLGLADTAYQKPSGGIPAADIASGVIPTVPAISTDITTDASSDTKTTSPKAVKTFVEGKGYGTYSKPSGGIPKTDLASAVQTSLGLADTAVQPEAGKGLFSGNYNDLSNKPTIPTVPTIDTSIDNASSNTDTAGAKAVYDAVHPATGSSQPSGGMLPNVLYKLGTLTGSVTISLAAASDNTIANEWGFTFTAGSTAPTITWPASIIGWAGNCLSNGAPVITASKHYEVSIMDGIALIVEV